jgi:uncharacterized Zn finger protein (UPF0148 family)
MQDLTCPACHTTFVDPRVLDCGHVICFKCATEAFAIEIIRAQQPSETPSKLLADYRKKLEEKEYHVKLQSDLDRIMKDDEDPTEKFLQFNAEDEKSSAKDEKEHQTTNGDIEKLEFLEQDAIIAIHCPSCERLTQLSAEKLPEQLKKDEDKAQAIEISQKQRKY